MEESWHREICLAIRRIGAQGAGVRVPGGGDPAADRALSDVAAQLALHGHHARPEVVRTGGEQTGDRHRRAEQPGRLEIHCP